MPLRTRAACARHFFAHRCALLPRHLICGWGSAASSTHENENPAANNFARGMDMPQATAKPAVSCSPTDEISVKRSPSGWPSARHACLAPVTPGAYQRIIPCSRAALTVQRMRAWSLPALPFLSLRARLSVGRSAAGPEARAHGGPESDPSPPAQAPKPEGQVAVFPSVRGGARRDGTEMHENGPRQAGSPPRGFRV